MTTKTDEPQPRRVRALTCKPVERLPNNRKYRWQLESDDDPKIIVAFDVWEPWANLFQIGHVYEVMIREAPCDNT